MSKEDWTRDELGNFLAVELSKATWESFDKKELLPKSIFTCMEPDALFKEWIFLNTFEMFQGITTYMLEDIPQDAYTILDSFHQHSSVIYTKAGVFDNPSTFMSSLLSRYGTYNDALKNTKEPGPVWWISKAFCALCGNASDAIAINTVSLHFTHTSIANKNLIENLLKSIRLVETHPAEECKKKGAPKSKSKWRFFWWALCPLFIIPVTINGLTGILIPSSGIRTSNEMHISIVEYHSLPLYAKLLALGWSLFQVILGISLLSKVPTKKGKVISIILIAFLTLLYYVVFLSIQVRQ